MKADTEDSNEEARFARAFEPEILLEGERPYPHKVTIVSLKNLVAQPALSEIFLHEFPKDLNTK